MKLSTIAAMLVTASCTAGAWAQSECCEYSRKAKEVAEVEAVAVLVADETSACQTACDSAKATAILASDETSACQSSCDSAKATAILASDETSACQTACDSAKATAVLASDETAACQSSCDSAKATAVLASDETAACQSSCDSAKATAILASDETSACQTACDSAKATAVLASDETAACQSSCDSAKATAVLASDETAACQSSCDSAKASAVLASDETAACQSSCDSAKASAVLASDETAACQSSCDSAKASAVLASDETAACQSACDSAKSNAVLAVNTDMPMFAYVVGDKETMCSAQAADMASACDSLNVQYKVASATYNCKMTAGKAYAGELEGYLDRMTRISFVVGDECVGCPVSANAVASKTGKPMQYKVAGKVFDCPAAAIQASAMAYGMSQHVQLAYEIDGEGTSCSKSFAGAKECPVTEAMYVVGTNKTACEIEASIMLLTAKIEAATQAASMDVEIASNEG